MIIWLFGQSGSGKSTIAKHLKTKEEFKRSIILDGDEMRYAISENAAFSREDRHNHNLRVARLAKVLDEQGHTIIVSVITPFNETRKEISKIIDPTFVWVWREGFESKEDRPFEDPRDNFYKLDNSNRYLDEVVEELIKHIKRGVVVNK